MKSDELKLLYVCAEFPYPPRSGGLLDMWNRIQSLHSLGVTLDVIVTAKVKPSDSDRDEVEKLVRRLFICKRKSGRCGVFSMRPGHVAIRTDLLRVKLEDQYDAVLMHTEFTSDILLNKTLKYKVAIVRVDNDEYSYHLQTAKAERSLLLKLYFVLEAFRIRRHTSRILSTTDMLWFISHDELGRYKQHHDPHNRQRTAFVPAAIDLKLIGEFPLEGCQVLFVGNLLAPLNRQAVEWYVQNVHPRLNDVPGYKLAIVGSTGGKSSEWLDGIIRPYANIATHFDPEDLSLFYKASAVFVNPMQNGAGVKLKTIEAVQRGLPVVSTKAGTEGSGLVDGLHYKCADTPSEFAARVREFLMDRESAREFVWRSQEFIGDQYDQSRVLKRLLREVSDRCRFSEAMPNDIVLGMRIP
jgi:glycosyltransferase involved in cell wall biosynthesis